MAEAVAEHRDVRAHMPTGHRLAEYMGALQMSPLVLDVGPLPRCASRRSFLRPSFTEFAAIRFHVLSSRYVELMALQVARKRPSFTGVIGSPLARRSGWTARRRRWPRRR